MKRLNPRQRAKLITEITQVWRSNNNTSDDEQTKQFLQELYSSTSHDQHELITQLRNGLVTSVPFIIKVLVLIMAIWAVKFVFKDN